MAQLAVKGGTPIRTKPFTLWPIVTESDREAVLDVLDSGKWGRYLRDRVDTFEKEFAALVQVPYCVGVTNGTAALEAALRSLEIGAGDEVIVPPYTFYATASTVLSCGALPILVDVDADTFCLDSEAAAAAVTGDTRAMVPVQFAGASADMDKLMEVCSKHNLYLVEDACQSHLAEWKGKQVGTFGEYGCFSFQASKNLSAGEGGALVTNDEALYKKAYSYHTCGRALGGLWYKHYNLGTNFRMSEFQGALLLSQMQHLEEQTQQRIANAAYLTEQLQSMAGISTPSQYPDVTRHVYHLYVMKYDVAAFDGIIRDRFIEALLAEGIPAASGYVPLHKEPFVDTIVNARSFQRIYGKQKMEQWKSRFHCPVTDRLCEEAVWLPQNVLLGSQDDMNDIVNAMQKVYENRNELLS